MKVHRSRELGDREPQSLSLFSEWKTGQGILLSDSRQLGGREAEHLRKLPKENLLTSPSS